MPKTHDIAVLGATAAGYVAAVTLAKKGRDVVVLACPESLGTESPLADWIPADVFKTCRFMQQVKSAAVESPFRAMHFHSADLADQSVYRSRSAAGFVLRPAKFLKALAAAAKQAGARTIRPKEAPKIDLQEQAVVLSERAKAGREVRAAVLLIAQGGPAEAMANLGMTAQTASTGRMSICGMDIPLPPQARRVRDKDLHVVALAGDERFGMFFHAGNVLHVRIVHLAGARPIGGEELAQFIGDLQYAGLAPPRLNLSRAAAAMWRPPGGEALEMGTHIAKRTLLVGTAGGFASALTGATLSASIRSALSAADVADRTMKSDRPQETLAEYKDQWRDTLADRIRRPGTSLQMMLSMVLANKNMTTRFAKAFLYGENI